MSSFAAGKRVSQSTFDSIVDENESDFGMDRADAISDAISQLKSQGVDLSGIDTSGGVDTAIFKENVSILTELYENLKANGDTDNIEASALAISQLTELCQKDNANCKRNHFMLKSNGGLLALYNVLSCNSSMAIAPLLCPILRLLMLASKTNDENRDYFDYNICESVISLVSREVDKFHEVDNASTKEIIVTSFKYLASMTKSEGNKVMVMRSKGGELINSLLRVDSLSESWTAVKEQACVLMRGLCLHDDLRSEMSCANDNGKFFLNSEHTVQILLNYAAGFEQNALLASHSLAAARNLVTTEESVQIMCQNGALDLPKKILLYSESPVPLIRSLFGFMRNLCADDIRKDRLIAMGILSPTVFAMLNEKFMADNVLQDHAIACLAQFSLRSPSNSAKIVESGALLAMAKAMIKHNDKPALLRQGCLCIRNIAARCPEFHETILDTGFEPILRAAGRYQDAIDEAYAALRDLKCEVKYVKISTDGTVTDGYDHFSENKKPNFNPVYEESNNIQESIVAESRAPFAASR